MVPVLTRVLAVVAAVLMLLALPTVARSADPPGVLWQSVAQPEMPGMPWKPAAQTSTLCTPRVWTRPPASADPNCTSSNFSMIGSRATWTVQCGGQMPMTGLGEMTFNGTDSYVGNVTFTGGPMAMTIKLTGQKVGACANPQ